MHLRTFSAIVICALSVSVVDCGSETTVSGTAPSSGPAPQRATITQLSTMTSLPMGVISVIGSGFGAFAQLAVRFFDNGGYSVDVPVIDGTSTALAVAVPPYFGASGALGAGTVNVEVVQSGTVMSNVVGDFQIGNIPTPTSPAGTATLIFIGSLGSFGTQLQQRVPGSTIDSPSIRSAMTDLTANASSLAAQIQPVVQGTSQSTTLGNVGANAVTIDSARLAISDRMIVAMLTAQANASSTAALTRASSLRRPRSSTACASQEAAALTDAMLHHPENQQAAADNYHEAFFSCTADAGATAFKVLGASQAAGLALVGAGAAPAVLAASAGVMAYLGILYGFGMAAVAGMLGQSTPGSLALMQGAIARIEATLKGIATKTFAAATPDLLARVGTGQKILDGLSTLVPSSPTPILTPSPTPTPSPSPSPGLIVASPNPLIFHGIQTLTVTVSEMNYSGAFTSSLPQCGSFTVQESKSTAVFHVTSLYSSGGSCLLNIYGAIVDGNPRLVTVPLSNPP